jgi:hypothetical protein
MILHYNLIFNLKLQLLIIKYLKNINELSYYGGFVIQIKDFFLILQP